MPISKDTRLKGKPRPSIKTLLVIECTFHNGSFHYTDDFLLDTGTSHSVMTSSMALFLGFSEQDIDSEWVLLSQATSGKQFSESSLLAKLG